MQYPFYKKRQAHLRLGKRGENIACKYLRLKGMRILLRNHRNSFGEIDIIALDDNCLCFIEVKTRRPSSCNRPVDGFRYAQQCRVKKAANAYMNKLSIDSFLYRFDLIEIIIGRFDIKEFRYWQNFLKQ